MPCMVELITHLGLAFVFANVLLERAGLPLPAMPAVVVAAALSATGTPSMAAVFGVAFAACMIGDALWYAAGWRYGRRVISMLCRISLSPDSCVRQTEQRFERWGALTLVIAKFVPGLLTIARPLAGTLHMDWKEFALLNGLGSAAWVGACIWAGVLLHAQIDGLLERLQDFGPVAFEATVGLVGAYVAFKWWERRRFAATLSVARIDAEELRRLMREEPPPVVVDLRSALGREQDPRSIPGAVAMSPDELIARRDQLPRNCEIVLYCGCPREASAAIATRKLRALGYGRVRPLLGGLDAWTAVHPVLPSPSIGSRAAIHTELH